MSIGFEIQCKVILSQQKCNLVPINGYTLSSSSKPYLCYKTEQNAGGLPGEIFIREINEDGMSFSDESIEIMIFQSTRPEEEMNIVEGQSIIYREPFYYLLHSAFPFNHYNYHVSVARSTKVRIT